ncbi:MAG TPA: DUF1801 domain-containing protein [Syntrophomonas sp.]|nr:DUF1801 domain-containing protein [Syntrophomonas sp.]
MATIDDYIAQMPEEYREALQRVRETIRAAAPEAVECIKWQMPTFFQKENLIHFAYNKNHLGIYPGEGGVRAFAERLSAEGYKTSKGAVQFPWSKPIPYELIAEIARYRVKEATGGKMYRG